MQATNQAYATRPWRQRDWHVAMIDRGITQTAAALELGVDNGTISQWATKFNLEWRHAPGVYADPAWHRDQIALGRSRTQAGASVGTSGGTVGWWARRLGITWPRVRPPHHSPQWHQTFIDAGLCLEEVATATDRPLAPLRKLADELGVVYPATSGPNAQDDPRWLSSRIHHGAAAKTVAAELEIPLPDLLSAAARLGLAWPDRQIDHLPPWRRKRWLRHGLLAGLNARQAAESIGATEDTVRYNRAVFARQLAEAAGPLFGTEPWRSARWHRTEQDRHGQSAAHAA